MNAPAVPLRIGSATDLAALQGLFTRAQFIEHELCTRLKIKFIHEVDTRRARIRLAAFDATDPQGVLARLFVLGTPVPAPVVDGAFEAAEREALFTTGLLDRLPAEDEGAIYCPLRLMPITTRGRALRLACDRQYGFDGQPIPVTVDVVFPPHSFLTRQFLSVLPQPAQGAVLDLCSGSGVAALLTGAGVSRVVAVDITTRSTIFARFNAWVNGHTGLEAIEGDLYRPLGGEQFRWVLAHPPYVPTFRQTAIFRDGGELGDSIVRAIVEGLPSHLEVGGTLYMVCMGMDTSQGLFEERVRQWMGDGRDAYDIIFATSKLRTAESLAEELAEGAINPAPDEQERRLALFQEHGVTAVVHGAVVARRLAEGTKGETHRVRVDTGTSAESFDWLFRWIAAGREPGFADRLLASTPTLHDGTTLDVRNVVERREVMPKAFTLGNNGRPFPAKIETDPWVVRLVMMLDGSVTLEQALHRVHEAGYLPDGFHKSDAERVIRYLIERGILGLELPA